MRVSTRTLGPVTWNEQVGIVTTRSRSNKGGAERRADEEEEDDGPPKYCGYLQ